MGFVAEGTARGLAGDELWEGFSRGDAKARERLFAMHYDEFRSVARRVLNGSSGKLQIQPTDLAHEAAIRLLGLERIQVQGHTHFLALSARVMRQTLIDEVRAFKARKRGGGQPVTLLVDDMAPGVEAFDPEILDDLLRRLEAVDPDRARVVELRFFAGLTMEEIAEFLGVSERTVQRRWRGARAWLLKAYRGD
jgi:RNA polymerase sigma factor (TIGR02999 family)